MFDKYLIKSLSFSIYLFLNSTDWKAVIFFLKIICLCDIEDFFIVKSHRILKFCRFMAGCLSLLFIYQI